MFNRGDCHIVALAHNRCFWVQALVDEEPAVGTVELAAGYVALGAEHNQHHGLDRNFDCHAMNHRLPSQLHRDPPLSSTY